MKLRYLIILASLLLIISNAFAQNWIKMQMEFSTGDTSFDYFDARFVTKDIGWFVSQPLSKIFKTTDGGYQWFMQRQSYLDYYQLFALDSYHVWMRLGYHRILYTKNGGIDWDSTYVDSSNIALGGLYFFNREEGLFFGKYLYSTDNGGNTWEIKNTKDSLPVGHASSIKFFNRERGWIGGYHPTAFDVGFLCMTTDSGNNWDYNPSYTFSVINGLDIIDSLSVIAVGISPFVYDGYIHISRDGGVNWNSKSLSGSGWLYDVGFIDSLKGWVCGDNGIWATSDGGENWLQVASSANITFKNISVLQKDKLVFVFGLNGTLMKLDLDTGVIEKEEQTPIYFDLAQNFPNPFNSQTTISYKVQKKDWIRIQVYDILGKYMATLVNEVKEQGEYNISWDAEQLPSGVYQYQMISGKFIKVRKAVLIK